MKKLFLGVLMVPVFNCQAIITEQLEANKNEIQEIKNDSHSAPSKCGTCRGCKSKCRSVGCSKW